MEDEEKSNHPGELLSFIFDPEKYLLTSTVLSSKHNFSTFACSGDMS